MRFGVTAEKGGAAPSPNWVRVSDFPNVLEAEPNDTQKTATVAQKDLPLAFNGILSKPGDVDWFRFKAKKDQSLDLAKTANHYELLIESGVSGLIVCGSLGENQALEPDEKRAVVALAVAVLVFTSLRASEQIWSAWRDRWQRDDDERGS